MTSPLVNTFSLGVSFGLCFLVVARALRGHVLGHLSQDGGGVAPTNARHRGPTLRFHDPSVRCTRKRKGGSVNRFESHPVIYQPVVRSCDALTAQPTKYARS